MGVVLGSVVWLERATRPLIVTTQVVPKVALIPLFIIWFGFGMTSKIIIVALLAFFPIMLNILLGVRSVEAGHRELMRSLNAARGRRSRRLEYHSTSPTCSPGTEVGIVFAITGAVVGEYIAGDAGLGYIVVTSMNNLEAATLFALILVLRAGLRPLPRRGVGQALPHPVARVGGGDRDGDRVTVRGGRTTEAKGTR